MHQISIVIPTYNRPEQLSDVIDHLLKSEVANVSEAEILIVDDGSQLSAEKIMAEKKMPIPFSLKYIRQENAGPAAARNNGFRNAKHNIVLFIDDDILAFPDMIKRHIEGHALYPKSVVFGYCPYLVPLKPTPAYKFLEGLVAINEAEADKFILTTSVASGNISVEKELFPDGEFYKSTLRTPAAEEFELMARLSQQKIKVYFNSSIRGWHLQPTTLEDKCKQEYKYGIGVAEVGLKVPYSLDHANLKSLYYGNCLISANDPGKVKLKKRIKSVIAKKWSRQTLLKTVKFFEVVLPFKTLLFPLYRMLAGLFVFAGVRDGVRKFSNNS